MPRIKAKIAAIKSHVPDRQLGNETLAEIGKWDADTIYQKTGISVRRIAGEKECASDLGVAAARKLFEHGDCTPEDIDFLLFCTQTPDYFLACQRLFDSGSNRAQKDLRGTWISTWVVRGSCTDWHWPKGLSRLGLQTTCC